jgi:type I restriction enzyme S subunit
MIPPLPEQRQIAEILSSVDEAIHATGAVIEQTRVVKYGVLDRLMTKENGGVNFSTGPVSTCESWSETTLGAICVDDGLQTGPFGSQLKASEYVDAEVAGAVAVVMPQDLVAQRISTRKIARTSQEKAALLSRHRLIEGDIMFGRRGDIGRAALVTKTEAGFLCGTGCLRARLKKETADPFYVMAWLGTERSQKWLNEHAVGQTMLNLNTKIIGSLPVSLPSMSAQMNVRQGLQHFEGTLDDLLGEIATLRAFKSALMSDLLTGRKRVTDTMALAAE